MDAHLAHTVRATDCALTPILAGHRAATSAFWQTSMFEKCRMAVWSVLGESVVTLSHRQRGDGWRLTSSTVMLYGVTAASSPRPGTETSSFVKPSFPPAYVNTRAAATGPQASRVMCAASGERGAKLSSTATM